MDDGLKRLLDEAGELSGRVLEEDSHDGDAVRLCELVDSIRERLTESRQKSEPEPVAADDFVAHAECPQKLSDEQLEAVLAMTYFRACLMRQTLGSDWDQNAESAFVNGASCVFFALQCADKLPAFWFLGRSRMLDVLARHKKEGKLNR